MKHDTKAGLTALIIVIAVVCLFFGSIGYFLGYFKPIYDYRNKSWDLNENRGYAKLYVWYRGDIIYDDTYFWYLNENEDSVHNTHLTAAKSKVNTWLDFKKKK